MTLKLKKTARLKKKRYRVRGGASMPCPCKRAANSCVVATRRRDLSVFRQRQCLRCHRKFETTEERT